MTNIDRRIAAATTGQLGIVTRQAAHAAGVADHQLRSRVMSGTLVQTGPHTFKLFGAPDTPIAELTALLTDLGEDAFASGQTAAALHGFDAFQLVEPFDVTLLRNRNMRRIGHRIHTTATLPLIDRAFVQGCPTTSGARTMIDLARCIAPEQLRIAFDSGLRDGVFSEDLLHRRIVGLRGSGRYGIPRLLDVIEGAEAVSGAHSWLEREFLRLIAAAQLPSPDTQVVLATAGDQLVRVDFRFPGTNIVVEVHGYRYHRTQQQMSRDAERANALLDHGLLPYQFTYEQVVDTPCAMIDSVRQALHLAPS